MATTISISGNSNDSNLVLGSASASIGDNGTAPTQSNTNEALVNETVKSIDLKYLFTPEQLATMDLSHITEPLKLNIPTNYSDQRYMYNNKLSGINLVVWNIISHLTGLKFTTTKRSFIVPEGYELAGEEQTFLSPDPSLYNTGDESTKPLSNRGHDSPLPYIDITNMLVKVQQRIDNLGEPIDILFYEGASFKAFTSSQENANLIDSVTANVGSRMDKIKAIFDAGLKLKMVQGHQITLKVIEALPDYSANIVYYSDTVADNDVVIGADEFYLSKTVTGNDAANLTAQPSFKTSTYTFADLGILSMYLNRNHPNFLEIKTALNMIKDTGIFHVACYSGAAQSQLESLPDYDITTLPPEDTLLSNDTVAFYEKSYGSYSAYGNYFSRGSRAANDLYAWDLHYLDGPTNDTVNQNKPGIGLSVMYDQKSKSFRLMDPLNKTLQKAQLQAL